jgi:membrane-associated HD superfamily phosphohydrolase
MTNIVLPSFARCQSKKELTKRYFQVLSVHVVFSIALVIMIAFFPSYFLLVLGRQYSNLKEEIVLMAASKAITVLSTVLWNINSTKGWIDLAWMFPPTIISTQVLLLLLLDISTVRGVILFSTFSIIPASCLNFLMTYRGLRSIAS